VSNVPFTKVTAATAAEISARFDLAGESKSLLSDGMKPHELLNAMLEKKQTVPAIDFLAYALPSREGIWWGCLCMQHVLGNELPAPDRLAARAAVQWIMHPGEEARAAAKAPAEAAGPMSPAGNLALAVYQTGVTNPPQASPFSFAKSVATAVKVASLKAEPAGIAKLQRSFLALGIEIAEGRYL
jgi:hypothetical protein